MFDLRSRKNEELPHLPPSRSEEQIISSASSPGPPTNSRRVSWGWIFRPIFLYEDRSEDWDRPSTSFYTEGRKTRRLTATGEAGRNGAGWDRRARTQLRAGSVRLEEKRWSCALGSEDNCFVRIFSDIKANNVFESNRYMGQAVYERLKSALSTGVWTLFVPDKISLYRHFFRCTSLSRNICSNINVNTYCFCFLLFLILFFLCFLFLYNSFFPYNKRLIYIYIYIYMYISFSALQIIKHYDTRIMRLIFDNKLCVCFLCEWLTVSSILHTHIIEPTTHERVLYQ